MGQLSPCCSIERDAFGGGPVQVSCDSVAAVSSMKHGAAAGASKSEAFAASAASKVPRAVPAATNGCRQHTAEDLLDGALEAAFESRSRSKRSGSDDDDARSEGGQSATSSVASRSSSVFGDLTKEQRREAKLRVKTFTQEIVRGKSFSAVAPTGDVRPCFLKMTRQLDVLLVKANKRANNAREIPLIAIDAILAGDAVESEGLQTPLSELSVTLALKDQTFITFSMASFDEQDTFVKCFMMFVEEARMPGG